MELWKVPSQRKGPGSEVLRAISRAKRYCGRHQKTDSLRRPKRPKKLENPRLMLLKIKKTLPICHKKGNFAHPTKLSCSTWEKINFSKNLKEGKFEHINMKRLFKIQHKQKAESKK